MNMVRTSRLIEVALSAAVFATSATLFLFIPDLVESYKFRIPGTTDVALDPDFFPRVAVLFMGAMALLVILSTGSRDNVLPIIEVGADGARRSLAMITGVIVYLAAIYAIGFIMATIAFVAAVSHAGGYRRSIVVIPVAVIIAVSLHLLFRYGLSIQLPWGAVLEVLG